MMSEFFSVDPSWCSTGCCVLMATAVCFLCDPPVTVSLGDGHRAAFTGTGQLLPLLGLGLGRKTAALTGSEGEPWELSVTSAVHQVPPPQGRPWHAVCRRPLGPSSKYHTGPVPERGCAVGPPMGYRQNTLLSSL